MNRIQYLTMIAFMLSVFSLTGGNAETAEKGTSSVMLLTPKKQETVSLLQEEHKKFWDTAEDRKKYDMHHWKVTNAIINAKRDNCRPAPVEFTWKCNCKAKKFILVISGDGELRRICTKQPRIKVDNLRIGTRYLWFVDAIKPDGDVIRSNEGIFRTSDKPPRWINLPGISNVRDVGGWKTADGKKRIRQGLIYRGGEFDGHQNITPEGRAVVRDILNLKSDWDLRHCMESGKGMTEYPLKELNVHLINRRLDYNSPAGMASAMHFLATLQEYPVYIHCWGGADRTGRIVLTLQALLGVADEDLLTDYELTSFGRWGTRSRNKKTGAEIRSFLDLLDKYGKPGDSFAMKTEAFLRAGGLSQWDIDFLRNFLLESL